MDEHEPQCASASTQVRSHRYCRYRYAEDDCFRPFFEDAKEIVGALDEDAIPVPGGSWSVYYRLVQEEAR